MLIFKNSSNFSKKFQNCSPWVKINNKFNDSVKKLFIWWYSG